MSALLTSELRVATAPIESTGRARHDVGMLVSTPEQTTETKFRRIADHLDAGDVLVVNTSSTEPAALDATWRGGPITLHAAGPGQRGGWVVELRSPDRSGPITDAAPGDCVSLADGSAIRLIAPRSHDPSTGVRLWETSWHGRDDLLGLVRRLGSPIRYSYVQERWPLASYRTIFERRSVEFASAEMPSAARPFTQPVLDDLTDRGVLLAAIELHTGLSSPETHEPPEPERFHVGARAARRIAITKHQHRRVIAVGTTAARAVESAVTNDGKVGAASGWTNLVLSRERPAKVIDGILTGWHPPEASHLALLESITGAEQISSAYRAALEAGMLSHEFGDSCLLL